jgi:hypothetical protein
MLHLRLGDDPFWHDQIAGCSVIDSMGSHGSTVLVGGWETFINATPS